MVFYTNGENSDSNTAITFRNGEYLINSPMKLTATHHARCFSIYLTPCKDIKDGKIPDRHYFIATSKEPELQGLVTQGDTLKEVMDNANEVAEMLLEEHSYKDEHHFVFVLKNEEIYDEEGNKVKLPF